MKPLAVLNCVALSQGLLAHAPRLLALAERGQATLQPVLPAVTTSVQSAMLTGTPPSENGIVANGWFNAVQQEIQFWKQSNKLVEGEKVWHAAKARDPQFTCLNSFWWYNMYSDADYSITPRPQYKADGRKIPDCYSHPPELRDKLQAKLGQFPLFRFWGPMADISSSQWIADATIEAHKLYNPTLSLVYLPHLDYPLQKLGPDHADIPAHIAQLDKVAGQLIDYFEGAGVQVIALSEYGIEPVSDAVAINRALREAGFLSVRREGQHELLDAGASQAFAIADHQIAHVYVQHGADEAAVRKVCEELQGVAEIATIGHERAGTFTLVSDANRWFSHDYWLDDAHKPDFAHTVDIHRKPGYDPRELFCQASKLGIAWRLLRKKLGFRQLMDVIPLDPTLVKGSHGRVDQPEAYRPVLLGAGKNGTLPCTDMKQVMLDLMFEPGSAGNLPA